MESSNFAMASLVWVMVFNAFFKKKLSYIMGVSFIGGGNRSAPGPF
jgi:hypothetical protein